MRPARKSHVVQASWGAPVDFTTAKVVSNKVAAPGMHQLLVDVGAKIASGYITPGQYIQAKTTADGKAGFFAIASGPDPNNHGVLELLIKTQPGATAEALCALETGAEILVSPVQGKGFPVTRIPAADFPTVLMFATGSGISPIKAVIESGVLDVANRQEVRLYYGTRSPESTAYQSLVPEWEKQGIKVVQVHSGDAKKYVQGVFAEDVQHLSSPSKVGVLLCGQKDMCNTITELAKAKGVEQIMLNF